MEYKVVIADPETGKCYKQDLKEEKARRLTGKKIGEEIDGSLLGLTGYKLKVTGGSDKCGFPMKKGIQSRTTTKILTKGGTGYRGTKKMRVRKRVRGENITEDIVQINMKIIEKGKKSIEELLNPQPQEKKE